MKALETDSRNVPSIRIPYIFTYLPLPPPLAAVSFPLIALGDLPLPDLGTQKKGPKGVGFPISSSVVSVRNERRKLSVPRRWRSRGYRRRKSSLPQARLQAGKTQKTDPRSQPHPISVLRAGHSRRQPPLASSCLPVQDARGSSISPPDEKPSFRIRRAGRIPHWLCNGGPFPWRLLRHPSRRTAGRKLWTLR